MTPYQPLQLESALCRVYQKYVVSKLASTVIGGHNDETVVSVLEGKANRRPAPPTAPPLSSHTFPISFLSLKRTHTQPKGLSFLYSVSVFNQCLKCISLSTTFPSFPGVRGNWTLTNAYVSNFADGGGAARRAEQEGGGCEGRREEEWEMGFAERLRTRTFLSSRHSSENAEAKQMRSRLTDGVFTCYLPQLVSLPCFVCLHLCVSVRDRESGKRRQRYKTPTRT